MNNQLKCNVVMLTTESKSSVLSLLHGCLNYTKDMVACDYTEDDVKSGRFIPSTPQHLYITSNRPIKDGDWVYYQHPKHDDGMITRVLNWDYSDYAPYGVQHIEGYGVKEGYRKLEATTDPELPGIHNSGWKNTNLIPQIGEPFIKAYVESYNAGNPITEVLLEMDQATNQVPNGKTIYWIKTRPDNTVIIKRLKESYTKDEVESMIRKALFEITGQARQKNSINEWLDKNL